MAFRIQNILENRDSTVRESETVHEEYRQQLCRSLGDPVCRLYAALPTILTALLLSVMNKILWCGNGPCELAPSHSQQAPSHRLTDKEFDRLEELLLR